MVTLDGYGAVLSEYLLERSSIIVIRFDSEARVAYANRCALGFFGEGCIGRRFADLLIDFSSSFDMDAFMSDPGTQRILNFSTASGMPETLKVTCIPDDHGGLIIAEHDLAELQEFRSSVLELNQSLGNLSRELQKKNAELQHLNDLKNQFLGMAAHDLRNPISTIISYANVYLDDGGDLTEEMVEVLADIRSLADFMLHMIIQLLDISVIEMGKLMLDEKLIEVSPFVGEAVKLNGLLAGKKGITLEQHFSGIPAKIRCDRHKIKQVLNNLISNAIKFSSSGTTVSVSVIGEADHIRVEVRDQGPGISREEQELLFKPFGRGRAKATAGERSTGLGLAISRRIVEAHGGSIGVESTPEIGSMFWFVLPCRV